MIYYRLLFFHIAINLWLVKWITYGLSSRKLTATPSGKLSGGQAVSYPLDKPLTVHLETR